MSEGEGGEGGGIHDGDVLTDDEDGGEVDLGAGEGGRGMAGDCC